MKLIVKLYSKIFKRKELKILKEFRDDCNRFYNSYMNSNYLLNDTVKYGLKYEITNHDAGIMIYRIYQGLGLVEYHFYVENKVIAIYIETTVNKLLGHELVK